MAIHKESLSDLKENFQKAEKLVKEENLMDPAEEPYKSLYEAAVIFIALENKVEQLLKDCKEEEDILIYSTILGHVYVSLGEIFVNTEELSGGQKYLMKAKEILEEFKLRPEVVIPLIDSLNKLGILNSKWEKIDIATAFLNQAESIFKEFSELNIPPLTILDVFGTKDEIEKEKGFITLEKIYTHTLYYLAQVLSSKDIHKSAQYCHQTLKRQIDSKEYEAIDWSLNCATISQYFFTNNQLTNSRHHLAAASYVLDSYEKTMIKPEMNDEEKGATQETFNHRSADVARCWAKYGLNLLSTSKDRLMDENENGNKKIIPEFKELRFDNPLIRPFEDCMPDKLCLTFEEAKIIFLNTISWLNKSKEYYVADGEASEWARITQDMSSAYKYLAFFEEDFGNQCKIHKKRADLLEEILTSLNQQYYKVICQECFYELGLTYSTMLDTKLDQMELNSEQRPSPHALNKINVLCGRSIKHFQSFLDSFKNKETQEISNNLSSDELQPILFAYFHLGRLFYKIITVDKMMYLSNLTNSLKYYNLVVKTCSSNESAAEFFKGELSVCKEMASLLPLKIINVSNEVDTSNLL